MCVYIVERVISPLLLTDRHINWYWKEPCNAHTTYVVNYVFFLIYFHILRKESSITTHQALHHYVVVASDAVPPSTCHKVFPQLDVFIQEF
jgi:hypothetical protein